MKSSRAIVLVLSGALATYLGPVGCYRPTDTAGRSTAGTGEWDDSKEQDNNAYTPGLGYYHAPFGMWYPFAFNSFQAGRGYYHGGAWHPDQYAGPVPARSRPSPAGLAAARSAFRGPTGGSAPGGTAHTSNSIIRGGFGGSSHFGGS